MSMKYCCPMCFHDRGLKKEIFPLKSKFNGTCSYCKSDEQPLLSPTELTDYFSLLIGIYSPDSEGRLLIEWLKEDWCLFNHPIMDHANAQILLGDILDDGQIVRQSFSPSALCFSDRLKTWESLRDELMQTNRYFPDNQINKERFEVLLSQLILDVGELPLVWYRARLQKDGASYPIDKMGCPPRKTASHGRANPAGIPYLYLGSKPETATAEIRPHTGQKASVAEFTLTDGLKIVDLRDPRKMVSPFLLTDEAEIALLRGDIEFLDRLGEELTRPVLPESAVIDYIPSQYLCEFIKKCGYHGVLYRSSVSDGMNLALFDERKAAGGAVSDYNVDKVWVDISAI